MFVIHIFTTSYHSWTSTYFLRFTICLVRTHESWIETPQFVFSAHRIFDRVGTQHSTLNGFILHNIILDFLSHSLQILRLFWCHRCGFDSSMHENDATENENCCNHIWNRFRCQMNGQMKNQIQQCTAHTVHVWICLHSSWRNKKEKRAKCF